LSVSLNSIIPTIANSPTMPNPVNTNVNSSFENLPSYENVSPVSSMNLNW
jgi:hypothetical protein